MTGLAVGLILGGMATSVLVWILSGLVLWIPHGATPYIIGLGAICAVGRDLRIVAFPLPERRKLVPKSILDQPPPRAAIGFGIELGLGFRTFLSASAPYLLVLTLLLSTEPLATYLLTGAAFGLGRFALPLSRYMGADAPSWSDTIDRRKAVIRACTALLCGLCAIILVI